MHDNLNKELLKTIKELEKANSKLAKMNKELKESNALHSSIIESSPEVNLFALDSNYSYIEFNSKHKEEIMSIWGKEIKIGMSFLDVIDGEIDHGKVKSKLDRALAGEYFSVIQEYSNGELPDSFWKIFWSPICIDDGQIIGLTCFAQDITERIRAQKRLENEMKFTEAVLDSSPGMLYMYDEEGNLVKWNKKHEEMTGFNQEELRHKKIDLWFDEEDFVPFSKMIEDVFNKGFGEIETKLLINDGKSIDILSNNVRLEMDGKTYMVGAGMDITNRKKLEEDLMMEKKFLEATLISVRDGVIACDNFGRVSFLNRVAEILTGWTKDEAKGKPIGKVFEIINEFTRKRSENIVEKVLKGEEIIEFENDILLISRDGTERPIEDNVSAIITDSGTILGAVLVFRDCTSRKEKLGKIKYLSYRDQLTGLYNRRYFEKQLKRMDLEENLPLSMVMGDINGLKLINDTFGHEVGDNILKSVANIIGMCSRPNDIIARMGGDEFIILLPNTDEPGAESLINNIKDKVSKVKIENLNISISFGYGSKENMDRDILEVLKNTEDYMHRNKLSESWSIRSRTIEMLMNSLYEKSNREMLHSKRVGEICRSIATELGLKDDIVKDLYMAGLMHDIGKIGINESILDKTEKLTNYEWEEIQKHPDKGYRILSSVSEFSEIAKYILEHHERWDGKGYPRGLKSEEITLHARIIAIADAYDAMTNDRTYRPKLSKDQAIEEILNCSGKQFDPEIAKVFIEQVADKID